MSTDELNPSGIPTSAESTLTTAEIVLEGRMPWASNATFLVRLEESCGHDDGDDGDDEDGAGLGGPEGEDAVDGVDPAAPRGIYKPLRGERPLWDFEPGLHRREVATYRLSETMALGVVPPTVLRHDGPLGEGSVQWFVDADHREHYFTVFEQRPELHDQLRDIALLDVVANNTDRKSGHCLLAGDRVWAIDNGLCFAAEFKLRTVIWEFAGDELSAAHLDAAAALAACVPDEIAGLLAEDEVEAVQGRARWLADHRVFPGDDSGHRYPWPLV